MLWRARFYAAGMRGLNTWWTQEVVDGPKGPLLLALVAFVVTFLMTRMITRLIRAGRGPFHNISNGSTHLHHSTPGTVLLVAGAFTSAGADGRSPWSYLGALGIGIGASLVLDEFAMIFHLQDVYWSQEGQLSVNVASLAAVCVGLALAGVSPDSAPGLGEVAAWVRGGMTAVLVVHLVAVVVVALKGKLPTALISIFVLPLALYAAIRIARPASPWARKFYSAERMRRASVRTSKFDGRWYPVRSRWDDFVGGAPTAQTPAE